MRYLEDFAAGEVIPLGRREVTAEEIVEFGTRYDPQPFHTDPDAAADGPFGGLIASGWHTCAMVMRMFVDTVLREAASMGSPGIDELRWRAPVRPGDVLQAEVRVDSVTASTRHPGRGTVSIGWTVTNQRGETVLTMTGRGLYARRPAEPAP